MNEFIFDSSEAHGLGSQPEQVDEEPDAEGQSPEFV
jgi:hypothetical protein